MKEFCNTSNGTICYGLFYLCTNDFKLGDREIVITSEFMMTEKVRVVCVLYGSYDFTWSSKKQLIVTLSNCEVEYVAVTSCICQVFLSISLLKKVKL